MNYSHIDKQLQSYLDVKLVRELNIYTLYIHIYTRYQFGKGAILYITYQYKTRYHIGKGAGLYFT